MLTSGPCGLALSSSTYIIILSWNLEFSDLFDLAQTLSYTHLEVNASWHSFGAQFSEISVSGTVYTRPQLFFDPSHFFLMPFFFSFFFCDATSDDQISRSTDLQLNDGWEI